SRSGTASTPTVPLRAKTSNPNAKPLNQRKEETMRSQHNANAHPAVRDQSVLAMLRALVPNRPLTPAETLRIAELQANHLLRHFRIATTAVPEAIVSELPRVRV